MSDNIFENKPLNEEGLKKMDEIKYIFINLDTSLGSLFNEAFNKGVKTGSNNERRVASIRSNLENSCFMMKKVISTSKKYQK